MAAYEVPDSLAIALIATASVARPAGRARDHEPYADCAAAPNAQPMPKPRITGKM